MICCRLRLDILRRGISTATSTSSHASHVTNELGNRKVRRGTYNPLFHHAADIARASRGEPAASHGAKDWR